MTRYRLFESVTNETLDTVELTEHGDIIGGDSGGFDIVAALISTRFGSRTVTNRTNSAAIRAGQRQIPSGVSCGVPDLPPTMV